MTGEQKKREACTDLFFPPGPGGTACKQPPSSSLPSLSLPGRGGGEEEERKKDELGGGQRKKKKKKKVGEEEGETKEWREQGRK